MERDKEIRVQLREMQSDPPKDGQCIIAYKLNSKDGWTWVCGECRVTDDGIFLDYEIDMDDVSGFELWCEMPVPQPVW
jgi:hypothetical protein